MNSLASTADLRAAMEQVSGQKLDWLLSQWLTRSGVPAVSGTWRYDAAAKAITVTVRQTQSGDPYRLSVDVGVTAPGGGVPVVHTIELTGREATLTIPAAAEPATLTLDPNVSLLATLGSLERVAK
jgi:aminopeptidase N